MLRLGLVHRRAGRGMAAAAKTASTLTKTTTTTPAAVSAASLSSSSWPHPCPCPQRRRRLTGRAAPATTWNTAGNATGLGWAATTTRGVGGGGLGVAGVAGGGSGRAFSDNLLGYSPMANAPPSSSSSKKAKESPPPQQDNPGASGPSFGVDHNTAGGGVWNNTSSKKEKLTELRAELVGDMHAASASLDDAATPAQRLDLHLAEGIGLVARSADEDWPLPPMAVRQSETSWEEFGTWLDGSESPVGAGGGGDGGEDVFLDRDAFESHLLGIAQRVAPLAVAAAAAAETTTPEGKEGEDAPAAPSPSPLVFVREFVESPSPPSPDANSVGADGGASTPDEVPRQVAAPADDETPDIGADVDDADAEVVRAAFDECASLYRATLVTAAADHLRESWDALTSVTDSDVDRAAVGGVEAPPATAVSAHALNDVVRAYAFGTADERLRAMWALVDRDGDGMIDQEEMDRVVYLTMTPVENAMRTFFDAAIQSGPVRNVAADTVVGGAGEKELGWRQRRLERKTKKKLKKMFDRTIKRHFDVEVETPHRLRCVYAWADKSHQDGKVESVLVDSGTDAASAIMGKKRYVELHPKITHEEFTAVQREQFPHLDRVGQEIATSFKEDLLVDQGKGRQNKELKREVMGFLVVVGLVDYIILSL